MKTVKELKAELDMRLFITDKLPKKDKYYVVNIEGMKGCFPHNLAVDFYGKHGWRTNKHLNKRLEIIISEPLPDEKEACDMLSDAKNNGFISIYGYGYEKAEIKRLFKD